MDIFSDFFQSLSELTQSLEFGVVIKSIYMLLPDQIINTLGLIFCISILGFAIRFLKGWF